MLIHSDFLSVPLASLIGAVGFWSPEAVHNILGDLTGLAGLCYVILKLYKENKKPKTVKANKNEPTI